MTTDEHNIHELRLQYLDVLSKYNVGIEQAINMINDFLNLNEYKRLAQRTAINKILGLGDNDNSDILKNFKDMDAKRLGDIVKQSMNSQTNEISELVKSMFVDTPETWKTEFNNIVGNTAGLFADSKESLVGDLTPDERSEKISNQIYGSSDKIWEDKNESLNKTMEAFNDIPSNQKENVPMIDSTKKILDQTPIRPDGMMHESTTDTIVANGEDIPLRYEDRVKAFQNK